MNPTDISQNRNDIAEIDRQQRGVIQPEAPEFNILNRALKRFVSTNENYFDTLIDETEDIFFKIK